MKKILFLLLFTIASYGQAVFDEGIQIKNNTTDNSATKVNVQSTDGTINTISKSDLVNVVEVNDAPSLPLTGEAGKIYVVKNVSKIYRWNGTFYQELAVPDHNSLSGLQGGTSGEYNHLTNAQISELQHTSVATVWVASNGNNSTAKLGNARKPYLTIDAALDALPSTGGVVNIGIGSFSSPTPSKVKSNTSFIGAKEPAINSTVTISAPNTRPTISPPTALINGTILTGEFSALNKSNITVQNLGIDVGKTWVDTFNGGITVGGLVIASITAVTPVKGIQVNNVTVLGYAPATAQHCMLFENIIDSKFDNLTTYYHVHGVALKGLNITMDGLNLHSHNNDGLIIKSDIYAPTRDISVNNVNINSLSGYEGGGIILEEGVNGSSLLERVSLNNVNLKYVKFGLNNVNKVSNVNISNFNLYDSNTFGIKFDNNVDKINLSGINIVKTTTDGIDVSITGTEVVNIVNSSISDATGIGYKLTTAGNALININNSNTLNTTASYVIIGTGVCGSSNFGTGTLTGYIKFNNPFVKSNGRIFSTGDSFFGDLASTNGSLDMRFSNSSQIATIESFNFTKSLKKPLEISSLNYNVTSSGAVTATTYSGGATLTGTPTAPTAAAGTNTTQIATTSFVQELASSGVYAASISNASNIGGITIGRANYMKIGNVVSVNFSGSATFITTSTSATFEISLPFNKTLTNNGFTVGSAIPVSAGIISTGIIQHINSVSTVRVIINSSAMNGLGSISGSFMYNIED